MPTKRIGKLTLPIILLLWVFVLAFANSGQSQSSEKTQGEKNALLLETAESLYNTDTKTSVSLARLALKNAEGLSDEYKFNAELALGSALTVFDNYPEAGQHLHIALALANELQDERLQALASLKLGTLEQKKGNLDLSLYYYNAAREVFVSINDQTELAKTLQNIGNTYHYQGKNNEALDFVSQAHLLKRENKLPDTTDCVMNKAIFHAEKGNFPEALELYLDALAIYESRADEYNISQVHSNLGVLYKKTHELEKAEHYYLLALETQQKLGHRRIAHLTHNNLGLLYFEQGKTELALQHLQKALDETKAIGSYHSYWAPLLNLGYYHNEAGNHQTAIDFLLQAYTASDTTNNVNGKALTSIHLASAYDDIGRLDLAKRYGADGIKLSGKYGNLPTLEYALYIVQNIYKSHGEYEEALDVYEQFTDIKDSIMNAEKATEFAKLEARYKLSEKELEIQTLDREKKELELNEEVSRLKLFGLIGVFVTLYLVGFFYFRIQRIKLRQQQMKNSILQNEVTSVAKQMAVKNRAMENLKEELTKSPKHSIQENNTQFLSLFKLIDTNSKGEEDWNEFVSRFNTLHPTFFARLQKEHPELSNTELRLAALIKLRMTAKEIAEVINITPGSVKQARYRLKKKLGLPQEQGLAKFLYEF
jgi:tetratricopeptide (TPR) repeat protein